MAVVRFGERAAIGSSSTGCHTSTHGGAIETAFDEATAELCKASCAALATTVSFSAQIKKPVPLHASHKLECSIESVESGGLRINTVGTLKDEKGVLLASCKAQLVDVTMLRALSSG